MNLASGVAGLPRSRSRQPHAVTIRCALGFIAAPPVIEYVQPWLLMGTLWVYSSDAATGLLAGNIILMNPWRWYAPLFLLSWLVYLVMARNRPDKRDKSRPSPHGEAAQDRLE